MLKILLTFIFLMHAACYADEPIDSYEMSLEKILDLESGNEGFVGGVHVMTGDFVDTQVDMVVPGPQPLVLKRSYHSAKLVDPKKQKNELLPTMLFNAWTIHHGGYVYEKKGKVYAQESNGLQIPYKYLSNHSKYLPKFSFFEDGITNTAAGAISGRTNIKNNLFFGETINKHSPYWTQRKCDGGSKHYRNTGYKNKFLEVERHANGITTLYDYKKWKDEGLLKSIHIVKEIPGGTNFDYANFVFDYDLKHNPPKMNVYSSSGQNVEYRFIDKFGFLLLSEVTRPREPKEKYDYIDIAHAHGRRSYKVERKESGSKNFLEFKYLLDKDLKGETDEIKAAKLGRVREIKEPVGEDNTAITTYTFDYDVRLDPKQKDKQIGGKTTVWNAHGIKTEYIYNEHNRLDWIQYYTQGGTTSYRYDKFEWGHGDYRSYLFSKAILNASGAILACHRMAYDFEGNVVEEQLEGNLTGQQTNDCYKKYYSYSQDHLHLLLRESNERIWHEYKYYENTDRLYSHTIGDASGVKLRHTYKYDNLLAVCEEQIDGGNNQTDRYIKKITNTTNKTVGLPEIIEEWVYDSKLQQESLIKKVKNTYNEQAQLIAQEHFDRTGASRFTLFWKYDAQGNCITETNALKHSITRQFDEYGNKTLEQTCGEYVRQYEYDCMNRLSKEKLTYDQLAKALQHDSPQALCSERKYDFLNRCTSVTNFYGQTTYFVYDDVNRGVQTVHPCIPTEDHQGYTPISYVYFDEFNRPIKKIDQSGFCTSYTYTLRGQPCFITYADGSTEQFFYTLDGYLDKKIDKNGTSTQFTYDYKGRITGKCIKDSQGVELTVTSAVYDSFHLIAETDAAGNLTTYDYEYGRLVGKTTGRSKEKYIYDELGRVIETRTFTSETDFVAKVQEYDLLNRVVLEKTVDHLGQVSHLVTYEYDVDGNITRTRTYQDGERFYEVGKSYDAFHRLLECKDMENHETAYHYHYQEDGYKKDEIIDPSGNHTFRYYDHCGRLYTECVEQFINGKPFPLKRHDYFYMANGNLIVSEEKVYLDHEYKRTSRVDYAYDNMNRLVVTTESLKEGLNKVTFHQYNLFGQKTCTIKPDGTRIFYEYDALGRVTKYYDERPKRDDDDTKVIKTFSYSYTYDANSNVVEVLDNIHSRSTSRTYDGNDRLLAEKLANGLSLHYQYDDADRITQVELPDQTGIQYRYDGMHLKEIARLSRDGEERYKHTYMQYNVSGKLMHSKLIGNAGEIKYIYDIMDRPLCIACNADPWDETSGRVWYEWFWDSSYDKSGNVLAKGVHDVLGQQGHWYTYDRLNQLTSEQESQHTYDASYQYDSIYNRREKNHVTHTFNALNQLEDDGECTYCYDQNGNLIQIQKKSNDKTILQLEYDGLDRLVKVIKGNEEFTYHYDHLNRRIYKIHWNKKECQTWTYIYQGMNEIGAYTKGEIAELRLLGKGLGAEIGAAVAMELQGKVFAPVHDSNGNVVSLLDTRLGLVCDCHRYTAFGTETLLDEYAYSPWRFASKRRDPETGFIYFGRRYYAPEMGRFITADPLGFDAGPNLYAFVSNNPLTHFDEYGLEAVSTTASKSSNAGTNNGKVSTSSASSSWSVGSIVSSIGSFMSDVGTYVVDALSSPRVQGTLQTIGGAGEAVIGGSAALFSEGLAAPIGLPVMIHGLDNMFTGLQTCWYGTSLSTATSMCMQNMGMSHEMAEIIDGGLSLVGPCGAGKIAMKAPLYISRTSQLPAVLAQEEAALYGPGCSSANAIRLNNSLIAKEIGYGHAFEKHVVKRGEFPGISSPAQFADFLEGLLNQPLLFRPLQRGRSAYWDVSSETIILRDPYRIDGGTAFRPERKIDYFFDVDRIKP